jgi:hypothetical protein
LTEYCNVLAEHGAKYSLEECREDFKQAKLFALIVTFPITRCTFMKPFFYDPDVKELQDKFKMVQNLLKNTMK